MKKFKIITLGCRTNQYESQGYADQLRSLGYERAEEGEAADVCIVNTCTVTDGADRSSRQEIRRIQRENPGARLAVTGCMVESHPEAVGEGVLLVKNQEKESLIEKLFPEEENLPEFEIRAFDGHTRAFVKVQDGCNSFCTYCIIPYVRGRSRSRSIDSVLEEVRGLVKSGYLEVVITGINVGDFDGGGNLADLVRAVDQVEGLKRLRISSIDPDEVGDELLHAVMNGKTTCPSMHLVLQSGSNVVLKRMNRKYTKQIFLETFYRLKAHNPDFTATTDVIVGFPGETESDFEETVQIVKEVKFARVHIFPYSPRKKTRAALYPNQVPQQVLQERKARLAREAERAAFELRQEFVGRKMEVLVEGGNEGHTMNFLPVLFPNDSVPAGQIVICELVENRPDGLVGRIL